MSEFSSRMSSQRDSNREFDGVLLLTNVLNKQLSCQLHETTHQVMSL